MAQYGSWIAEICSRQRLSANHIQHRHGKQSCADTVPGYIEEVNCEPAISQPMIAKCITAELGAGLETPLHFDVIGDRLRQKRSDIDCSFSQLSGEPFFADNE